MELMGYWIMAGQPVAGNSSSTIISDKSI